MSRGRKKLSPAAKIGPELGRLTHEAAAEEAQLKQMTRNLTADQLAFSEDRGAFNAFTFVEKTVTVTRIKLLLRWHDSKKYKGLTYFDPSGKPVTITTFAELCLALGLSRESADLYMRTFRALGEEFMESAQRLGIGITTMRQLSKLPEDEREAAKLLVDTEGKEALVGFVADLCAKHAREKRALEKEIKSAQGDLDAQRNVTAKKNQKLDELEAMLHRRQADLPEQIHALQMDCISAEAELINAIQKFRQIRLQTMDLLNGNEREWNDDNVLGAVGVTHLTLLWQGQAWLVEEMQLAEQVFGGSKIEIHMTDKRAPDLTEDEIARRKQSGAEEARRVAGTRPAGETTENNER